MRFRSEEQRQAVMARLSSGNQRQPLGKRLKTLGKALNPFRKERPLSDKILAGLVVGGLASLPLVLGRNYLGPKLSPEKIAALRKAGAELYPGLRRHFSGHTYKAPLWTGGGWADVGLTKAHTLKTAAQRFHRWLRPGAKGRLISLGDRRTSIGLTERVSPAVMAHELGHATAGGAHTFNRWRRRLITIPYEVASTPQLAAASILASEGLQRQGEKRENKYVRRGLMLAGAAVPAVGLPILAEEAIASGRGLRIMRKAGFSRMKMLPAAGLLGAAYLTYLGGVGAPILKQGLDVRRYWKKPKNPTWREVYRKFGIDVSRKVRQGEKA